MRNTLLPVLIIVFSMMALCAGAQTKSTLIDDKTFYPPRLSTAERKALTNVKPGAFVYDLDKNTFYFFDGQNWSALVFTNDDNLAPMERTASDGLKGDAFGVSVAVSGDYAVIGAHYKKIGANNRQGAAYVFVRSGNTWAQQAMLTAADGEADNKFGTSVAISGDYIIVGAPDKTVSVVVGAEGQGAAYVFKRTGSSWAQEYRIVASDRQAEDRLGTKVAMSGDYALVASYGKKIGSNDRQGAVYLFIRSGTSWVQQTRLTPPDGAALDEFGTGLAMSGDYAIIGAPRKTIGQKAEQGAAYVYVRGGGTMTLQTTSPLVAYNGDAYDLFGKDVAISDNYAVVSSTYKSSAKGMVYVYTRTGNTWAISAVLEANAPKANEYFGSGLSMSGDYLLVGARGRTVNNNVYQGAAFLFKRGSLGWAYMRTITDDSPPDTSFGGAASISNGTFVIGSYIFQDTKGKVSFGTVD